MRSGEKKKRKVEQEEEMSAKWKGSNQVSKVIYHVNTVGFTMWYSMHVSSEKCGKYLRQQKQQELPLTLPLLQYDMVQY